MYTHVRSKILIESKLKDMSFITIYIDWIVFKKLQELLKCSHFHRTLVFTNSWRHFGNPNPH